jgi:AraC family transcriptional regulator
MLARRFAEKVTLAELGDAVGVHPVHLARAFRKHCGTSIGEHVRALRLEHARDEVLAGVPLAEVAVRSGFADQSHFTKAFSRAFGIGPAAYRRIQGRSSATRSSRAARRIVGA